MTRALFGRALLLWLALLVLASLNGALREFVLVPAFGRTPGLLASGALLIALIAVLTTLAMPWLRPGGAGWRVGSLWLLLTLAFEFGAGVLQGRSWPEMLGQYRFRDGNLWPLVLLVILIAPPLAARLRGA